MAEIQAQNGEYKAPEGSDLWRRLVCGVSPKFDLNDLDQIKFIMNVPSQRKLKPGISNESQALKDALAKDPSDLSLIHQLGCSYANEGRWDMTMNVMLRGWKRAATELPTPEARFNFLMMVAATSFINKKYKQADAVLKDLEEPKELDDDGKRYWILACRVAGQNKDTRAAMKAFSKLRENEQFDGMLGVLVVLQKPLRMAGAYEAAFSAVKQAASNEYDEMKVTTMSQYFDSAIEKEKKEPLVSGQQLFLIVVAFVSAAVIMYLLWWLETANLKRLKIRSSSEL